MASVKTNLVLNGINTVTSLLFPLVTFPYATRVLMPDGIGLVNFQYSIINYIILLTSLGIPLYAVKEIARVSDDRSQRDRAAVEIIVMSVMLCLLGYVAVWAIASFVPQIHRNASLFYVLSAAILFTSIGVEWFYKGIEDFKFITIRAIVVKTLSAAGLFIFVRTEADIVAYGAILVSTSVGNNLVNFINLRRHISLRGIRLSDLRIWRHVKGATQVFVLNLIISIYVQLNTVMLGIMAGDDAVGFFVAGTKIPHIALTLITSVGVVLLPRCSNLVGQGKMDEFSALITKSLRYTVGLALPMTVAIMILARPATMLFCGPEFGESVAVLALNAPVVLAVSLTNVLGIQLLYPLGRVRIVVWSVSAGALLNVLLNLALIPAMGAVGASIAATAAELAVLVVQVYMGRRYFPFARRDIRVGAYLSGTLVMSAVLAAILAFGLRPLWTFIISVTVAGGAYAAWLVVRRDELASDVLSLIMKSKKTTP